MASQVIGKER